MTARTVEMSAETFYELIAREIPEVGLRVRGTLDFSAASGRTLPHAWPRHLQVDVLNLSGRELTALPAGLQAYELIVSNTLLRTLPADLQVCNRIDLSGCHDLESLPAGLTVGSLVLRGCTGLRALPENLDVWFLDLTGCWAFERWPAVASIRSGHLQLRGCTALRELPPYLTKVSAVTARECPNLTRLPPNLQISGWLELAHSGLTSRDALPPGSAGAQLKWTGVNIDTRLAFEPHTITIDEILSETNAERRRVLLDRYGYGRFLQDAQADLLDADTDPGGPRQLLRVQWQEDEDLVAMSCFCPSTGRQYFIRVPPTTPTCRHAAAWIAGFDNPDDYQPLVET